MIVNEWYAYTLFMLSYGFGRHNSTIPTLQRERCISDDYRRCNRWQHFHHEFDETLFYF